MDNTMNTANEITTYEKNATGAEYIRLHLHASKGAAMVDLTVRLEDRRRASDPKTYRVAWNANRGAGWMKGWKSKSFASEAEAREFAVAKWATLATWLTDVTPAERKFCPDFTCAPRR